MHKKIFFIIQKAQNILIHLHPSPDPDCLGSALAMYIFLKRIKKKVTLISGDSPVPLTFRNFPLVDKIINKNFFEVDLRTFDLFIALDTADRRQISKIAPVKFPKNLKVINIDHHLTNKGIGHYNLIDKKAPANCQVLYEFFEKNKIKIDKNMASCLLAGIYGDTMFKYEKVTPRTYEIITKLSKINRNFHSYIFDIDNSNTKENIDFMKLALNNIETHFNEKIAISFIDFESIKEKTHIATEKNDIPNLLKSVIDWEIGVSFIEYQKNKIKISLRTRNSKKYNLIKIAQKLGGGGHSNAAGANLSMPFDEAKDLFLKTIKKVYNL